MGIKFANNASSNITHALTADATSVSITPGTGDLFPSIVEGTDYFYATLAGNNGLEIVKVTNRTLDTMTIERAQDGTDALLFAIGDLFELRIVAADFEDTFAKVDSMLEESLEENTSMVNAALATKAPVNHASANTTYGAGTGAVYGHVKLSDDASELYGVSEGVAATPLAVNKAINDAVEEAVSTSASDSSALVSSLDSTLRTFISEETAKCLPLIGGTLTGRLKSTMGTNGALSSASDASQIRICGGDGSWNQGGVGIWYGVNSENYPGSWAQISMNPDGQGDNAALRGYYDTESNKHVLKYNNADVLTSAGGYLNNALYSTNGYPIRRSVDNDCLEISGSSSSGGGILILYGKDNANYPSECRLVAGDTNFRVLANGSSYLGGKAVNTIYSSGTNYIRYTDGLQICHVAVSGSLSTSAKTITFPVAFKSAPSVTLSLASRNIVAVHTVTGTSFQYIANDNVSGTSFRYIAIGRWK